MRTFRLLNVKIIDSKWIYKLNYGPKLICTIDFYDKKMDFFLTRLELNIMYY